MTTMTVAERAERTEAIRKRHTTYQRMAAAEALDRRMNEMYGEIHAVASGAGVVRMDDDENGVVLAVIEMPKVPLYNRIRKGEW